MRPFVLLAALLLGACATVVQEPAGATLGEDYAELTFHRDVRTREALGGNRQLFSRVVDGRREHLAQFTWTSSDSSTFLVPANEPIVLVAEFLQNQRPTVGTCDQPVSFIPRPAARYNVRLILGPETCLLSVVDLSTGQVPADLK